MAIAIPIWLLCSLLSYLYLRKQIRRERTWTTFDRGMAILFSTIGGPLALLAFVVVCWMDSAEDKEAKW